MSALGAVWDRTGHDLAACTCSHLLDLQSHLGPDGRDLVDGGACSVGRLSWHLLPEDDFDHQPWHDPESGLLLVADVQLDDPGAVAGRLGLGPAGAISDSRLVFEAWRQSGPDCLDYLSGRFAIIAWEPRIPRLVVVRDHLGLSPLFVRHLPDMTLVASLPQALARVPGLPPAGLDGTALVDRLALVTGSPGQTLFAGVERILQGHFAIITADGMRQQRWWRPEDLSPLRLRRGRDYADLARETFRQAVASAMRSRRPVATHLSAGLDSGGISAIAAELLRGTGGRLTAFTAVPAAASLLVAPTGRLANERDAAAATARHVGLIDQVATSGSGRDLMADMDAWAEACGEPFLNPTNLGWILAIGEAARGRGFGVMLTGALGNMLLTADGWIRLAEYARAGRPFAWAAAALPAIAIGQARLRPLVREYLVNWVVANRPGWRDTRVWNRLRRHVPPEQIFWNGLDREVARNAGIEAKLLRTWDHIGSGRSADATAMRIYSLSLTDPGLMSKGILALTGVDHRDPMADRRLAELCFRIPISQYLRRGQPRSLARRVLADLLPREVLDGRARGQQASDWPLQVRAALPRLRDEIESLSATPAIAPLLDATRFTDLLDRAEHADMAELRRISGPLQNGLLRNIFAARFARRALGGNS
ncbi:MAG: asparagine synthase-related protein [Pseudomonadota bacterium]|nr:asparagine synthase-related protein [Pseudomonadota bacterium]